MHLFGWPTTITGETLSQKDGLAGPSSLYWNPGATSSGEQLVMVQPSNHMLPTTWELVCGMCQTLKGVGSSGVLCHSGSMPVVLTCYLVQSHYPMPWHVSGLSLCAGMQLEWSSDDRLYICPPFLCTDALPRAVLSLPLDPDCREQPNRSDRWRPQQWQCTLYTARQNQWHSEWLEWQHLPCCRT